MSAESAASSEAEFNSAKPGGQLQAAGPLPTFAPWVGQRSPVLLGATNEMFPHRRTEWFTRSCSEPSESKSAACEDPGVGRPDGSPVRAAKPSPDGWPQARRHGEPADGTKAEERQGSKTSTQSTAVGRIGEDGTASLLSAFPSWDSACSTLSTACREDGSERQELASDGDAPSHRGSASSVDSAQPGAAACALDFGQGRAFEDCFALGRVIGDGAFGVVHKCTARQSGREYAVKVVEKDGLHPLDQAALLAEVRLQRALPAHDHIVSLHASFEEAGVMKLVMEMCAGGDLDAHVDDLKQRHRWKGGDYALSERAAAVVVRQLLSAVAFCHGRGVAHRDVKPGNILLEHPAKQVPLESASAVVKLCDFGFAAECRSEDPPALREFVGSPEYVAPEVARREDHGCAVDVWSAGVVLFECLRGQVPFDAETDKEVIRLVRKAEYSFDEGWSRMSGEARSCVEHLLVGDMQRRPSAAMALDHSWLCK